MEKILRVCLGYYFFGFGLFLLLAPWTPIWSRNFFLSRTWPLSELLLSPWARGALSGVGAIYISTGIRDTLRIAAGKNEE